MSKNANQQSNRWLQGRTPQGLDEEKIQRVIDFLIKKGEHGATYREIDLHLAGPKCNKKWLSKICGIHPDIYKEGETSSTRLFYEKGRNELWGPVGKTHTSLILTTSTYNELREKARELRVPKGDLVDLALRSYLDSLN